MHEFVAHIDSGHGWLEVPRKLLTELEIADDITPYSYQKGENVYLEEDCDAGTFIKAYQDKHAVKVGFFECHTDRSPIRNYQHYTREEG